MTRQLLELARLLGIQTSYLDMTKQKRDSDPDAVMLVLKALGSEVETLADVPEALAARKEKLRKRKVEPVMVAWDGKLGTKTFEFGYHDVDIKGQQVFVISAPKKAFFPLPLGEGDAQSASGEGRRFDKSRQFDPHPARQRRADLSQRERVWGLFAPVYALHSKRSPHAGDLTDFENFIDWMHSLGGTVAATLPMLAAFLDEPFEPSPYSPASRLFWNEFYIDFAKIPEFSTNTKARQLAEKKPQLTKYIDYRTVMAYKRMVLQELSRDFFTKGSPERVRPFRKFVREHVGVEDYARFRAVTDRRREGWNSWPERLRNGKIAKSDYDENTKNYHLYAQWIVQEQLQSLAQKAGERGQLLYLDLPLGIHPDGYDVWRDREFFVRGVSAGAPPDPVFTKGQNWGFPPMHPEAMRLNRYQYFIDYIRNHFRYARLLRIDHVMGLHRLYWIPEQLTGDKGVYVEYPAEELYAILSLESHRHRAGIVGENLGTVPPAVNTGMARHNIAQMYVVQYEIVGDPKKPKLRPAPEKSVASLNTHDMAPYRAFLDGTDIDDRVDLGFLDEKAAASERKLRAVQKRALPKGLGEMYRFLARSMASIVLVNVEDLWDEVLPQNVPSTNTDQRPNWRRRIRPGVEQIRRMAGTSKLLSDVFADR